MTFNDLVALINEEYTYYYGNVKGPTGRSIDQELEEVLKSTIFDAHQHVELETRKMRGVKDKDLKLWKKQKEDVRSRYYSGNDKKFSEIMLFWLEKFHEAEYKRYKLKQYGIECPECDRIINAVFNWCRQKMYYEYQVWFIIHKYKNDLLNFKGVLTSWDNLGAFFSDDNGNPLGYPESGKPEDFEGADPKVDNIYTDQYLPTKALFDKAKTIDDKIVAVTMALNAVHHNGPMLERWGLEEKEMDRLSNLNKKPWDTELYKEFGIKY